MNKEQFKRHTIAPIAAGLLYLFLPESAHAQDRGSHNTGECLLYQGEGLTVTAPGPCDPERMPRNSEILGTAKTGIDGLIDLNELGRLESFLQSEGFNLEEFWLQSMLGRIQNSLEYYQLRPQTHTEEIGRLKALGRSINKALDGVRHRNVVALPSFDVF